MKKESTSFFEKKEAKKLLLQILSASCEMNKSFLLLFFKKEVLALFFIQPLKFFVMRLKPWLLAALVCLAASLPARAGTLTMARSKAEEKIIASFFKKTGHSYLVSDVS